MSERSLANFMLFDHLLDNFPVTTPAAKQMVDSVFNPQIRITATSCGTQLGELYTTDYILVGKMDLATNSPFTQESITKYYEKGQYTVSVRTAATCIQREGVCHDCFVAELNNRGILGNPKVGDIVTLNPDSRLPFLRYLAESFSGSYLGISPMPTDNPPFKWSLYRANLTPAVVEYFVEQAASLPQYTSYMDDRVQSIKDPLEKVLYCISFYSLHSAMN